MGFFSSIKRLWSSNKASEDQETPQTPAETPERQPAEDAAEPARAKEPEEPVQKAETAPAPASAPEPDVVELTEQARPEPETPEASPEPTTEPGMKTAVEPKAEPTDDTSPEPAPESAPVQAPEPEQAPRVSVPEPEQTPTPVSVPAAPSGWRDTLLLTLREAEPRLSVWLSIVLEDLGPDARTGDELWDRIRFLLTALGAPEDEAQAFVADFAAWAERMEYEEVADFRSELQYRLALALDLEDEEDERNRIFL